jgi:hypothetical protein
MAGPSSDRTISHLGNRRVRKDRPTNESTTSQPTFIHHLDSVAGVGVGDLFAFLAVWFPGCD